MNTAWIINCSLEFNDKYVKRLDNLVKSFIAVEFYQCFVNFTRVEMKFLLFIFCCLPMAHGRFIITYYNYTNNKKANNVTFKMEIGNRRSLNFSYEIDIMNYQVMLTESGKS